METSPECTLSDCMKPLYAKGLCNLHWQRMRKHGDPYYTGKRTPSQRFWAKVNKTETCWNWIGAKTPAGYGIFNLHQVPTYTHRFAFEEANGKSPQGEYVDHICHNPACVRPEHLRLVTNKQNAENHSGLMVTNTSGARNVFRNKANSRWYVAVTHHGSRHRGGYYVNFEDAKAAAIKLRNKLFTHNDIDRVAPRAGIEPAANRLEGGRSIH